MNGSLRGSLSEIFWRGNFGHPTWCWRIIERIARRRFVSFAERDRIVAWYLDKHYADPTPVWRWTQEWSRSWQFLGGIVGERSWFLWPHDPYSGERMLYCRIENGRRVDSQHCRICGAGINPVWNGKPKKRLVCKHRLCCEIDRWQVERGYRARWYATARRRFEAEIRGGSAFLLHGYLEWLISRPKGERTWPKKTMTAPPKGCATSCSTRF